MTTPHINAKKTDFSDVVLMAGDPLRAKYIAENFFDNAIEVCNVRSMLGFTGTYKGRKVSVMGHGMGIPSCSIYATELIKFYDVKSIIRLGTCGAVLDDIKLNDIIIGLGASTDSNINRIRFGGYDLAALADFDMVRRAVDAARKSNISVKVGNIFTSDLYYSPDQNLSHTLAKYGILGIEMEAAGLYGVAAEYGAKALAICTVGAHLFRDDEVISDENKYIFDDMITIALTSILIADTEAIEVI